MLGLAEGKEEDENDWEADADKEEDDCGQSILQLKTVSEILSGIEGDTFK